MIKRTTLVTQLHTAEKLYLQNMRIKINVLYSPKYEEVMILKD